MKWKFLIIVILSTYSSISQVNYPYEKREEGKATDSTDLLKKDCSIPFHKYQVADRFYFPVTKENGKKRIRSYKYIKKNKKPAPDVYYHQIAGKIFTLQEIHDTSETGKKGQYNDSPYYLLKTQDNINLIYPYFIENLRDKEDKEIKVGLILPEAIYLDEVDKFKQQYLDSVFFANFPLKEKKYRKITVTDVTPGTKDKPIRVFYSYIYQKTETVNGITTTENTIEKDSIDVCDCGTNILPALIPNCKFSNFLLIKDPQINITDNDIFWDAIMEGKILIGMQEKHVIAALGKPLKVETENKKTEPVKAQQVNSKKTKAEKADGQQENVPKEITSVKTITYKNNIVVLENEIVKSTKKIE